MKKILHNFVALIFLIGATISCGKGDLVDTSAGKCGSTHTWEDHFDGSTIKPWDDSNWNVQTEGNNRVFQIYTPSAQNVCPLEHIKIEIEGSLMAVQSRKVHFRVDYRYGDFGTYGNTYIPAVTQVGDTKRFKGSTTFGIQNFYKEKPGSFYLNYEWVIENYLDPDVDLAYFKTIFSSMYVKITYYEP